MKTHLYWLLKKPDYIIYACSIQESIGILQDEEWLDAMYMLIGGGEL